MRTYRCSCEQTIFFENSRCVNCDQELGFLPDQLELTSLQPLAGGLYESTDRRFQSGRYRKCQNYTREVVCNWMVAEKDPINFCVSCRLDEMIPDLSVPRNRELWRLIEVAKRRLMYTLISLRLPILNRQEDPKEGLAFRFMADGPTPNEVVMTSHEHGLITLNIAEADDSERERRRYSMKEPYRTLLGHFRHEIGHYYWDRLIRNTKYLEPCRQMFGDERADYGESLKKYYAAGTPENWQDRYISVYSSSHPWEDWAETWAHYMHIQDTLETARAFQLVDRQIVLDLQPSVRTPWRESKPFEEKINAWAKLSIALNSINRSMGLKDIYPFVLSPTVIEKLGFISEVISDPEVRERATRVSNASVQPTEEVGELVRVR